MKTEPIYQDLTAKIAGLEQDIQQMSALLHVKDAKLRYLTERIEYLERMLYGSKRDRPPKPQHSDQPSLFDQFFDQACDEKAAKINQTAKEIENEAKVRRQKAKKAPNRPAKYQYYGLEERTTSLMPEGVNLDDYEIIGKDVTRVLHREPAKVWVEIIERPILRHKEEKNVLKPHLLQAPAPKAIIGGNHVGADLLGQIIIDKYVYHLPEYRQVKQYADMGVRLPASTINDWVHAVANKLYPLYESLGEEIRAREYLQIDEVPWRIADRVGKSRKGYAWQFFDATPDSHGLYFYYDKGSRGGAVARAQLKGYRGAIQTDGYGVYDYFEHQDDVTLLGCMAHVRRKFIEAQKSHPQLASKAIAYIQLLYELEANLKARGASYEEIQAERKAKALPIMDALDAWIFATSGQYTPSDLLGKAFDYAYKMLPRLRNYADNGIYQIDNNAVERNQRPSVLGRKNYLFSKNDRGAEDNAIFYSLLGSCEVVGVNKLEWLIHVLNKLTTDSDEDEIVKLLPHNYKKSQA